MSDEKSNKQSGHRISLYLGDEQFEALKQVQLAQAKTAGVVPTFSVLISYLIDMHAGELTAKEFNQPFLVRERQFAEEMFGLCIALERQHKRGEDSKYRITYHLESIYRGAIRHRERVEAHRSQLTREFGSVDDKSWEEHHDVAQIFLDVQHKAGKLLGKIEG